MTDLHTILAECCHQFRTGEEIVERHVGPVTVTEVYAMPHVDDAAPDLKLIDCHFMKIGVDPVGAELHRHDLIAILDRHSDWLVNGPSYMRIAAELEIEQDIAFMLMAIGEVLGLWRVITPATFDLDGELAERAARTGFIMINGYRQEEKAA